MPYPHISLTEAQRQHLTVLTTRGTGAVKGYRRAAGLRALDQGQSYSAVGRPLGVAYGTVARWAAACTTRGLEGLVDQPRSGRPLTITGPERAKLTALACSPAPDGHSQWSLRLLAGKAVELGYCRQLSAASAHASLKKPRYSPTASASGALGK